jgi:hypothetical protein
MRVRQSAEEVIDRRPFASAFFESCQPQMGVDRVQVGIGRDNVNVIRLQRGRLGDLPDRKRNVWL